MIIIKNGFNAFAAAVECVKRGLTPAEGLAAGLFSFEKSWGWDLAEVNARMEKARESMLEDVNNTLRWTLNELRALDAGEELPSDRKTVARRLRELATWIEGGGIAPDAVRLIIEASHQTIQR